MLKGAERSADSSIGELESKVQRAGGVRVGGDELIKPQSPVAWPAPFAGNPAGPYPLKGAPS
jgi:hypothetical protein